MIADIEAKRVHMVIIKDRSCLGRDYILTGRYMERYLKECSPGKDSYLPQSGKLYSHLLEIDEVAQRYFVAAVSGITGE